MIYALSPRTLPWLDAAYARFMEQYRAFYGLNWVHHLPQIYLVPDRATIDALRGEKTEPWLVGWAASGHVYVLDPERLEAESNHAYSEASYVRLVGHELAHLFTNSVASYAKLPSWLAEGVSMYCSGQLVEKKRPTALEHFLEYHDRGGEGVYREAGFAVEYLVETHGKDKLLALLKRAKEAPTQEAFTTLFMEVFGTPLAYETFQPPREAKDHAPLGVPPRSMLL